MTEQEKALNDDRMRAEISRLVADTSKMVAETSRVVAETSRIALENAKLRAETSKISKEARWYELVIFAGGASALTLAIVAVTKLFL